MLNDFDINEFHLGNNLFVDASAGTGKTHTIQQLVAKLVRGEEGHAGIPLSKILIVTYTDKATGELRDHIRQKMEECLAEENLECYREALQNIHTASIFTIHSFCQKVLHDFAYEAGASFNLEVVSDDSIETLIQRLIRDKWSFEPEFMDIVNSSRFDMDLFVKGFVNTAKYKLLDRKTECFIPSFTTLESIFNFCPEARIAWEILLKNKDKVYQEKKTTKPKCISALIDAIQAYDGTKPLFPGNPFNKSWQNIWDSDKLNAAIDTMIYVKDRHLEKVTINRWQKFIFRHVDELVELWQKEKHQNKTQSFNDMISDVHDSIVNGNGQLVEKLRQTYRYAIIDEFQDTNQLQWDIFKTIFFNGNENNIVVVGDPKQSIFSFQGADVGVYRKAIDEIKKENGRRLSTNYRSSDDIINVCNELFKEGFLVGDKFSESDVPSENLKKKMPTLNNEPTKPLWISSLSNEFEFANFAVRKIIECCAPSTEDEKKTALQIFDKDKKTMRNVRFSDFAILSRIRPEMVALENAMAQVGIPYTRYKDTNLFCGKECTHWISLLKALNAPDFSSWNRKFLNEALITDFFRVPLERVKDASFIHPTSHIIKLFIGWRQLIAKKRWAELQESIYQETEIDKFLSTPATLQQLAKIKQIGTYIFDYLYNNRVSLEEVIKHLQGLASNSENVDDDDGNLVAKGSDFDAVRLITIHSSKGLAFPITIITGGLRGDNNRHDREPYAFSLANEKNIGFDSEISKQTSRQESHAEWRRLMYVAYTRAESLMIVPQYKIWYNDDGKSIKDNSPFAFLARAIERLSNTAFARTQESENPSLNLPIFKETVAQILHNAKKEETDNSSLPDFDSLQHKVNNACIYQHSYSSLASKKRTLENLDDIYDNGEISIDGNRANREDLSEGRNEASSILIDDAAALVQPCTNYDKNAPIANVANYPRGANLGDALHKVFENLDFEAIGRLSNENEACNDAELSNLIAETYQGNSIPVQEHPEWNGLTASFIWNTMNAELPEIHGSTATGKTFCLKDLPAKARRAEMGFHLDSHNGKDSHWVNSICKGFIDLMFVREGDDGEYYSILDWKSDVMDDADYSDKEALSKKIEEDYSIQRVLYSYLLIKWLKTFYGDRKSETGLVKGLNEQQIFEKHFGGIYYALARGTKAHTCNGIYCQTWKSFADLEKSYNKVAALMKRSAKESA